MNGSAVVHRKRTFAMHRLTRIWNVLPSRYVTNLEPREQNDLSSHDGHRDATLVFFFLVAATFVFFLAVKTNCVSFLALLACCT